MSSGSVSGFHLSAGEARRQDGGRGPRDAAGVAAERRRGGARHAADRAGAALHAAPHVGQRGQVLRELSAEDLLAGAL